MNANAVFYPLSQPQTSIWYLEQKHPNTCMNIVAGTLKIHDDIDYLLLEEAINVYIEKNDSIRLRVCEQDGEPCQYVEPFTKRKIETIEFSSPESLLELYAWDEIQIQIPLFEYDRDLFYIAIVKMKGHGCGIYTKLHHLISDAWTMSLMGNKILAYYEILRDQAIPCVPSAPSFLDHIQSEISYEKSPRFLSDQQYWNDKFEVYPEPTLLKAYTVNDQSIRAARKAFHLSRELSAKIRSFCVAENVSVFALFMAALSIYIHRVTGSEDIILGTTILNRINAREKETAGMFVSVAAPLRIAIRNDMTFSDFLQTMTHESASVLRHQKYPYNYLLRDIRKKHKLTNRLFDIVLNYQNSKFARKKTDIDYSTRWHFSGYQVESLVIHINDRDDDGAFIIDYDFLCDVFYAKEIAFLHEHIISLLSGALDTPQATLSSLVMLSDEERTQILENFNDTAMDFPEDMLIHEFFEEQADRTPDHTAVIYKNQVLTYCELNERANQVAAFLRSKGACSDQVIGIAMYRSFEMISGLLGIIKSGAAYLPIDPNYPSDRIRYMLEDSRAILLLTQDALVGRFEVAQEVVSLSDPEIARQSCENLPRISSPSSLAYIIYTSGSTGRPKGVMVEHKGVVNRLFWGNQRYPITSESVILQKTPFTFDVSVWELFWWPLAGASLCILEPGGEKDPNIIVDTVQRNHVTTIHFVPSMLAVFLQYVEETKCTDRLSSIRQFFASGEAITHAHVRQFNRLLNQKTKAELHNLYGPTETTVEVTYFDCSSDVSLSSIPIGRPIGNVKAYILDASMNLLPIGIAGELYIGGVGVARGYVRSPELTSSKFVPNPFVPGDRLYKTGDRARWYPRGDIEYLGRMDFQVKIRGFRIELGEIEERFLAHRNVTEAVVIGVENGGNPYLCAYLVVKQETGIEQLQLFLSEKLPEYMIPSHILFLDKMPLSANGKADRKSLPSPNQFERPDTEYFEPENDMEKAIAEIWMSLLHIEKMSATESFMDLGGDSLHVISLVTKIHKTMHIDVSIPDVFSHPTVRSLASLLGDAEKQVFSHILSLPDQASYPVSSAQKRLYILHQLEYEDTSYNLPGAMLITGKLNLERLEKSFCTIISRHESLRTSFAMEDDSLVQRIHKEVPFHVEMIDRGKKELAELISLFVRPFALSAVPLMRVGIITLSEQKHLLLFDMHHIISDGASIRLLIEEFLRVEKGEELPVLPIQYRDYCAWQQAENLGSRLAEDEEFWLAHFAGEIPVLNLPTDFPRPPRKSFHGKKTKIVVPAALCAQLRGLALSCQTTLFSVLFSAYNVLLAKYCSQEDLVVGIPVSGRTHSDVSKLIGMFVNTLAIRTFPESEKTFVSYLSDVANTLVQAYDHQSYPFERLVDKTGVRRDLARNPLFDTVFILQNPELSTMQIEDVTYSPYTIDPHTAKFDLTLEVFERIDEMEIRAEYCTDIFEENTVQKMLSHYLNVLSSICNLPDQQIASISLLSVLEKHELLHTFNQTDTDYPKSLVVQEIFEKKAMRWADRTALIFENETCTYQMLNARANKMAHILRKRGVLPDTIVAVSISRGIDVIAGILAVLKAGGAYLPIDPTFPPDRLLYMLSDSHAALILTQDEYIPTFAASDIPCITFSEESFPEQSIANPALVNSPSDLMYIIYTSGSSGHPKGVMITHQNVVRLMKNDRPLFSFSHKDTWTLFHSLCFDFSVWEMYGALLNGGKLVIVAKDDAKDTKKFLKLCKRHKVTVLNQTPGAFYNFIMEELLDTKANLLLRYVIFGGEALKPSVLLPFHKKYPETELINMYGITETTVHVTFKKLHTSDMKKGISNIGKAIPTLKTYILDKNHCLLPIGIPGELCVSGDGVARGYLGNIGMTEQKFIPNPFGEGRLYCSGDLARVSANGELEYLGRIDNQVKIRGYRIELGEIESEIMRYPGMKEAIVLSRETRSGDKKLHAYYVSDSDPSPADLREALRKELPDYMVPTFFTKLQKIPLNRNGKADRKSLLLTEVVPDISTEYVAPVSDLEKEIADVWANILEVDKIGVSDSFFDMGGDSLSAIRATSRLCEMNHSHTLSDLYQNPTIRQLSEKILCQATQVDSLTGMKEAPSILVRLSSGSAPASSNIICFPYGGGNAFSFYSFSASFAKKSHKYNVYGVNLPGHDLDGGDLLRTEEISRSVFSEILECIPGEIILYGHCVGNAPLLETARLLEEEGRHVKALFFGGIFPPEYAQLYGRHFDPWMLHSDRRIIRYLHEIGMPKETLLNDYAHNMLRSFRHDARSYYRYFHANTEKFAKRLQIPAYSIVGENDTVTSHFRRKYKKWSRFVDNIDLHVIEDADHYFLRSHADELSDYIYSTLEEIMPKREEE